MQLEYMKHLREARRHVRAASRRLSHSRRMNELLQISDQALVYAGGMTVCDECGRSFETLGRRADALYCSKACANKHAREAEREARKEDQP